MAEGPVERVSQEEVVKAIREVKAGKAAGPSEVSFEMIVTSGEIGIGVMVVLYQGVLDGRGMPDDWDMVKVDVMQFGFMPGKGVIDAVFILRRLQEEYLDKKKKLYICFNDLEKAFDRVPRKVLEGAMRKGSIPEVMVRAVIFFSFFF